MISVNVAAILLFVSSMIGTDVNAVNGRRFYVDHERNEFIKDGEVFRYVTGSMHYFRVPRHYWRDRIRKMKAAGLNGISTYVEWSFHESHSGVYKFDAEADIDYFLTIAKQENMVVLLRPGPFISAERDFGGHPYWLLKKKPSIKLRSSDPNYIIYIKRWLSILLPKIVPHLYGNGGSIIMVQLENEYGHNKLGYCDKNYTILLRDLFLEYIEDKAQLYTTDECDISYVKCGHVPNVFSTIDFGPTANATECLGYLRQVQRTGPLVNSEFYVGWIAYWNSPRPTRNISDIVPMMEHMLSLNISFNLFLFHGGTNFGLTSAATADGLTLEQCGYLPQITSYDFTAPLDEAGDPTEKYYAIQRVLKEAKFRTGLTSKRAAPKGDYGTVHMLPVISLFDYASRRHGSVVNNEPVCFEDMDQNQGLMLYETRLPPFERPTKLPLVVNSLRDRGIVFLNGVKLGIMSRSYENTTMDLTIFGRDHKLSILVENQGRINDKSYLEDRKGILSNVTLGKHVLGPWTMTGYPLNESLWLDSQDIRPDVEPPAFYRGIFVVPQNLKHLKPLDTYLDTSGWSKGVAFINGINIGRYWPAVGPQITLYVPAPYLVSGLNTVVMVEFESAPDDFTVKFIDKPRLDS